MMKIFDFFEEKLNYNTSIFEYSSYLDFYVLHRTHSEIEVEIYFETGYTVGKFINVKINIFHVSQTGSQIFCIDLTQDKYIESSTNITQKLTQKKFNFLTQFENNL